MQVETTSNIDLSLLPIPAMIIYSLSITVIAVLGIIAQWKIYSKAGVPGYWSIIPFANIWKLFEIAWGSGLKMLFMLIPFAGPVFGLIVIYKLCKSFGKGIGFFFLLLLFPNIMLLVLAFGNSEYIGPQ